MTKATLPHSIRDTSGHETRVSLEWHEMSECLLQWSLVSNGDNSELLLLFWLSVSVWFVLYTVLMGVVFSYHSMSSPLLQLRRQEEVLRMEVQVAEYIQWLENVDSLMIN